MAGAIVAYAICFGFVFWANVETPLWADDYCRIIPFSIAAPFELAGRDYLHWTGRFFVTAITYVVMQAAFSWKMLVFDAANAAVFVLLVANVLALARIAANAAERPSEWLAQGSEIILVALLLWWLPRDIGETALWKTGSIGYLWAVAGELWVLRWMLADPRQVGLGVAAFGFVIATFLEPLSLVVSAVLVAFCARRRWLGVAAPWRLAVGHLAGTTFLLAAPGNFARAAVFPPSPPLQRLLGVVGNLGSLFDPCWIVALGFVILASIPPAGAEGVPNGRAVSRQPATWRGSRLARVARVLLAGRAWMFVVLATVYMAVLLGVPRPALSARVSFPASVMLVCYVSALFLIRPRSRWRDRAIAGSLLVALSVHVAIIVPGLTHLADIGRDFVSQTIPQDGSGLVTLPIQRVRGRLVYARKYLFFEGITPDPANFINVCFAKAMHVAAVVAR
jgi:hypothetical protein